MKEKILYIIKNKKIREHLKKESIEWSKRFTWEKFCQGIFNPLENEIKNNN